MRIERVTGYPVKAGFRCQFVVEIETDTGIIGLGEGGISGRELAMQGMLDHFATQLVGQDPLRIEHIWQQLYRGAYFEGGTILAAVVSAVDIALWDIKGKHLGVPVWQLLGGATRDRVPCFISPGTLSGPQVIELAHAAVAAGWTLLRFGPGMLDSSWSAVDMRSARASALPSTSTTDSPLQRPPSSANGSSRWGFRLSRSPFAARILKHTPSYGQ